MFVRTKPGGIEGADPVQIITKSMGVRVPPGRRADAKEAVRKEVAREIEIEKRKSPLKPSPSSANGQEASTSFPEGESDKLESIKITAPGTYELNLPSLFEREELIMAVKEGTYFIDLSSAFRKGKKD